MLDASEVMYEIVDYQPETCLLNLRRLTDPNGILLTKNNNWGYTCKKIRGTLLEKFYTVLPQSEEVEIRKKLLSDK